MGLLRCICRYQVPLCFYGCCGLLMSWYTLWCSTKLFLVSWVFFLICFTWFGLCLLDREKELVLLSWSWHSILLVQHKFNLALFCIICYTFTFIVTYLHPLSSTGMIGHKTLILYFHVVSITGENFRAQGLWPLATFTTNEQCNTCIQ